MEHHPGDQDHFAVASDLLWTLATLRKLLLIEHRDEHSHNIDQLERLVREHHGLVNPRSTAATVKIEPEQT